MSRGRSSSGGGRSGGGRSSSGGFRGGGGRGRSFGTGMAVGMGVGMMAGGRRGGHHHHEPYWDDHGNFHGGRQTKKALWIGLIVFTSFFLLGFSGMLVTGIMQQSFYSRIDSYTTGQIIHEHTHHGETTTWSYTARFRPGGDGAWHTVNWTQDRIIPGLASNPPFVDGQYVLGTIRVYYNSSNPNEASIRYSASNATIIAGAVLVTITILVIALWVFLLIRCIKQYRKAELAWKENNPYNPAAQPQQQTCAHCGTRANPGERHCTGCGSNRFK